MSEVTNLDHHRKRRRGAEMGMLPDGSLGVVRTYFLPDDEAKLLDEHEAEAERKGAEFYNYGAYSGDKLILSKTSKGRLTTEEINGKIKHHWEPYR